MEKNDIKISIKDIDNKIEELQKLKESLIALTAILNEKTPVSEEIKELLTNKDPKTFKEKILSVLRNNKPLTSKEIIQKLKERDIILTKGSVNWHLRGLVSDKKIKRIEGTPIRFLIVKNISSYFRLSY